MSFSYQTCQKIKWESFFQQENPEANFITLFSNKIEMLLKKFYLHVMNNQKRL